jgi:hypothetical protein
MNTQHYPDPCPDTKRRVVTLAQWAKRPDVLIDTTAYWYNPSALEFNTDPWRLIESVDPHVKGDLYDVWFASGSSKENLPGTQRIYITEHSFKVLTLPNKQAEIALAVMKGVKGLMKCAHDDGKYGLTESAATTMNMDLFEKELIKLLGELK